MNGHDTLADAAPQAASTHSIPLGELSLEQLVQVSQGLGHQIERLKEQRRWLNARIAERMAAAPVPAPQPGDAVAAGVTLDVDTRH